MSRRRAPTPRRARTAAAIGALVGLGIVGCGSSGAKRTPLAEPGAAATSELARQTAGLEARSGLIDLHLDRKTGRVLAVVPAPSGPRGRIGEYLYLEGIATGLGSNPVGLDRGQLGAARLIELRRVGSRLLMEMENLRFRALDAPPAETAAVRDSFASSVLWATEILAEDGAGRLLADWTGFLVRDAHGVAGALAAAGQGSFSLDRERSAVDLDALRVFPRNVEFESVLTFAASSPGPEVRAVAPDPQAVTLVLHQSLVALPEPGFRPRTWDPRMGALALDFADYAVPLAGRVDRRWTLRHRLQRQDPDAERSAARQPIVYYVDRAAPEPVRSALLEGAGWWRDAFAAAGFDDAFRVELLPEGADPLDVRYNVVQWVHRATRGWSYGNAIVDPRTGEILKGHVTLDSLRVRQDRLLFEGLAGTDATGSGAGADPIQLALARIRQLAAHEVGHTIGLAHNFAGSVLGRASVMDYPAPLIGVGEDGAFDFSRAYGVGVGAWDRAAIRWAYEEFPAGADEPAELERVARESLAQGLYFLSDDDARPAGAAHPAASLWDNGADPVAALARTMRVRRLALERFGEHNLLPGEPLARLEEVFATVYLHHRYQLAAAAKSLGGLDYRHALRGDGQPLAAPLEPERQRRALEALLETLTSSALDIPDTALALLLPRPPDLPTNREQFATRTRPAFDALGAAATAADITLNALLEPSRAARLVDFHRRDPRQPDFSEVLQSLSDRVFTDPALLVAREAEIARVVQRGYVERLLDLSADGDAAPWVRTRADAALSDLLQRIDRLVALDAAERAHLSGLAAEIGRHLSRPAAVREPSRSALAPPPGDPIGESMLRATRLDECGFERP